MQWSTQQASSMSSMHENNLLTTPGHFGPVSLPLVSTNEDEERCFLKSFVFS